MLRFLLGWARGALSAILYAINTAFWVSLLFIVITARVIIPIASWRRLCGRAAISIAENWISCNNLNQRITGRTRLYIQGVDSLKRAEWYLVLSNHQSWVDILILQRVFNRKIPFLKFFIKKELFWFPVLGQAWWALDFPFIKRYSKRFLEKYPHLKGTDLEITRKACEKFKALPISIMNFVEGTRFSQAKRARQQSPHTHLLKAKAGGIAFVLQAMEGRIHRILDVTIVYSEGPRTFWAFLCGKIEEARVHIRSLPVTADLVGDYAEDPQFRERFQQWLNHLWQEKDHCIQELITSPPLPDCTEWAQQPIIQNRTSCS
ncbi:MAG: acyltransferase [Desulfatitalea sp.]|nr:acyltransferase [Desulfatitalea sp.]